MVMRLRVQIRLEGGTRPHFLVVHHYESILVDPIFLAKSVVMGDITRMLTTSGWPQLLTLICEAGKEYSLEFLGTFTYIGYQEDEGFRYKFRVEHACTVT